MFTSMFFTKAIRSPVTSSSSITISSGAPIIPESTWLWVNCTLRSVVFFYFFSFRLVWSLNFLMFLIWFCVKVWIFSCKGEKFGFLACMICVIGVFRGFWFGFVRKFGFLGGVVKKFGFLQWGVKLVGCCLFDCGVIGWMRDLFDWFW